MGDMIPFTVRSNYSLMWGTASIKQLCGHARQLGYDRLALTDTDNLHGLWPFLRACRLEGLRPGYVLRFDGLQPFHARIALFGIGPHFGNPPGLVRRPLIVPDSGSQSKTSTPPVRESI